MKNLEEEGLIYSTTDDYHFKSTANGWRLYHGVTNELKASFISCRKKHYYLKFH